MKRDQNPKTLLFRFIVLATLLLTFVTVATVKIWELRVTAERVGVLHTLGSLHSAVGITVSERVIREGIHALVTLDRSNPMQLLDPPPDNYLGEFASTDTPPGQGIWYFDLDGQMLIYRVRFTDSFRSSDPRYPDLARYQLRFDYRDNNNNQQFDPRLDDATGLALQPVDRYRWLIETERQ